MMNESTETKNDYGADQIQILEGLEAVRKKTWYVHRKYIRKRTSSSCL